MGETYKAGAFVGLGRMGQPMALNMARKGFDLAVFDTNAAAMQPFTEFNGCRQATSPSDAAQGASIAITCLPGPNELSAVALADGGIIDTLPQGSVYVDLSTITPELTDALAAKAAARGVGFVDAPIGRLASHADKGESLFMVGASDADFARVKPALEAMGTTIHHCGPPGAGTRTKLINNTLAVVSCTMNAEVMALTQAFGLDLTTTLAVIHGTSATNGQLKLNLEKKTLLGDTEPGFAIDLAAKDLALILAAAGSATVSMPIAAAARETVSLARAGGYGRKDFSALADFVCEVNGVDKARLPKPTD